MKVAFKYIDEDMIQNLFTSSIRSVLKCSHCLNNKVEKAKRAATELVTSVRKLRYEKDNKLKSSHITRKKKERRHESDA